MSANSQAQGSVLQAGTPLVDAMLVVILLHGRGGSAENILGLASAIDVPAVAYLAPEAKNHTWYPQSFMAPRAANEPFLSSALAEVEAVVRSAEVAGFNRERVVIAGFSQGACLATEFIASHPARYGGLIALTGGLIGPPDTVLLDRSRYTGVELAGTPAFLGSGDPDPHVPWTRVQESAKVLQAMGASVTTRRYPGRPHTISPDEIERARSLILTASGESR